MHHHTTTGWPTIAKPQGWNRTCPTLAACLVLCACAEPPVLERNVPPRGSLGRELYGVLCDRVGAQSLREDLSGASFARLCHPDAVGRYGSEVDRTRLPALAEGARNTAGAPVDLHTQQAQRDYAVARVQTLAADRDVLVEAFDALLRDAPLALPPCEQDTVLDFRPALKDSLTRMVRLYEDGTVPAWTAELGQVLRRLRDDPGAAAAWARLSSRDGYLPDRVALGVVQPLLSYPRLLPLADVLLSALAREADPHAPVPAREGAAHRPWMRLLEHGSAYLRETSAPPPAPLRRFMPAHAPAPILSRPRTMLELTFGLLVAGGENPADATALPLVERDADGVARVSNAAEQAFRFDDTGQLERDTLLAPKMRDGQASPRPLAAPGSDAVPRDAAGRALSAAGRPLYRFAELRHSAADRLLSDVGPLLSARDDGGPQLLDDAIDVALALLGPRRSETPGAGFGTERSALLDLSHAAATSLAHAQVRDALRLFAKVARERPDLPARLVVLTQQVLQTVERHGVPSLRADSTLWDDLLDVLVDASRPQGLLERVISALDEPETVSLSQGLASYMRHRDHFSYPRDPQAPDDSKLLNGPIYNTTRGGFLPPGVPVDRDRPDIGDNRSMLQRTLQLLHDANGVPACSKRGAVVRVSLPARGGRAPMQLTYPTSPLAKGVCAALGSSAPAELPECGILRFEDVAALVVDVVLGRYEIEIRDECLRRIADSSASGLLGGSDAVLERMSGITGLRRKPTPQGLARLAFFDAPYSLFGGYAGDVYYTHTSDFLGSVMEPVASTACPLKLWNDPSDGRTLPMRRCDRFQDTLRGRDADGLFALETLDFHRAMQPLAAAFGDHAAPHVLVSLFDALYLHWGSEAQPPEVCDPDVARNDPRWCSQDGLVVFEPLLAELIDEGRLLEQLGELTGELEDQHLSVCVGREADGTCRAVESHDGLRVLSDAVRALIDPLLNPGLRDRHDRQVALRRDGSKAGPVTPARLWLAALSRMDASLSAEHRTRTAYERLLDALVDTWLKGDGEGQKTRLRNPTLERLLPTVLEFLSEQAEAHCGGLSPVSCPWAQKQLRRSVQDLVSDPIFVSALDLLLTLRDVPGAERELGRLATYLLTRRDGDDTHDTIVTALVDTVQLLQNASDLQPLYPLAAQLLDPERPGVVAQGVELLTHMVAPGYDGVGGRSCSSAIDPHGVWAELMRRAVERGPTSPAPVRALADVAGHVNRVRPAVGGLRDGADVQQLARELSEALLDQESGLEQAYAILRQVLEAK